MIREHITIVEQFFKPVKEAETSFGSNRPRLDLQASKQEVLDSLDRLLGCQACTKGEKIAALREVEAAAKRMADGIERHIRNSVRQQETGNFD